MLEVFLLSRHPISSSPKLPINLIYIIFFPYFMSMEVASMIEVLKREFRLDKIFMEKLKTIKIRLELI